MELHAATLASVGRMNTGGVDNGCLQTSCIHRRAMHVFIECYPAHSIAHAASLLRWNILRWNEFGYIRDSFAWAGLQEPSAAVGNASKVLAEPMLGDAAAEALPEDVAVRCLADYNPLEREEYEEVRGACVGSPHDYCRQPVVLPRASMRWRLSTVR